MLQRCIRVSNAARLQAEQRRSMNELRGFSPVQVKSERVDECSEWDFPDDDDTNSTAGHTTCTSASADSDRDVCYQLDDPPIRWGTAGFSSVAQGVLKPVFCSDVAGNRDQRGKCTDIHCEHSLSSSLCSTDKAHLLLIRTGKPMYVPVTQEPLVLSSDMVEEQQSVLSSFYLFIIYYYYACLVSHGSQLLVRLSEAEAAVLSAELHHAPVP